ncbi:MAG: T9SS type A sorting domain-containing protein [Bacteroidetes bacterium]|nr:T9SS type A sorting domain-containing protein [Bacteroidota bacterium]
MKKTITFFSILLISLKSFAQWNEVGTPGGMSAGQAWWVSMDFNGTTPYVAYRDCANGCSPTVRTYSNSTWQNVGAAGITGSGSDYVSLAINQTIPYIAFGDNANSGKLSVMQYSGGTWSYVGAAGITASSIIGTSMAFDGMGNLYVAYTSGSGSVGVKKWNGASWSNLSMAGFPTNSTNYPQISLNGSTPYLSYWDSNSGDIHVLQFSNVANTWSTVGAIIAGMAPSKVCFDSNQNPYLAYTDNATLKVAVVEYTGSVWTSVGAPLSISTVSVGVPTNGIALTLDGNTPYVAYSDLANNGRYSVSAFNGTSWNLVGQSLFAAGGSPFDFCTIKVISGTPYVSYKAFSTVVSNASAYVMKYSPLTTGINETQAPAEVSIYPNPACDVLVVKSDRFSENEKLEITDVNGKMVEQFTIQSSVESFDIKHLGSGMYFYRIGNTAHVTTGKFVKQ